MRPLVALLLFTLPVVAAPVPKARKNKHPPLDGYWVLVAHCSDGGEPAPRQPGMARNWYIAEDRILPGREESPAPAPQSGPLNLSIPDPAKPHLRAWNKLPAVFELDGDTLRACYASDGRQELTECKPGKGIAYYEFKRVKEK